MNQLEPTKKADLLHGGGNSLVLNPAGCGAVNFEDDLIFAKLTLFDDKIWIRTFELDNGSCLPVPFGISKGKGLKRSGT